MAVSTKTEKVTKLDSDVTKPSVTAPGDGPADTTDPAEQAVSVTPQPGDGPADTTDPAEQAVSVTPQPGDQAIAEGTVNAVRPAPRTAGRKASSKERIETYTAVKPDGSEVRIKRNIDTGKTEILSE